MTIPVFPYESPCGIDQGIADPELWFDHTPEAQLEALSLCEACPILRDCQDFYDQTEQNLPFGKVHGIVGGETPRQRRARRNGVAYSCAIPTCHRVHKRHGLCEPHLTQLRRETLPKAYAPYVSDQARASVRATQENGPRNSNPPETCTIQDCDRPHHARGMCCTHYHAHRRRTLARKAREQAVA